MAMGAGLSAQVLPDEALLISAAAGYLGTPYRYGGETSAGMDCSGFVMTSFKDIGIMAPRVSSAYAAFGSTVKDELRPGDILLFGDAGGIFHVGIYLGDRMFIHAASDGPRTGVIMSSLDESYWKRHYKGARRRY
ncbi:MAG: C40 family peptidase [Spirochaetales bacterium]|nr:C40 family peptidase [Spirochaetales bacterium]MBP7264815.1 C40 family peptidase [Spirochaetia bacterium]